MESGGRHCESPNGWRAGHFFVGQKKNKTPTPDPFLHFTVLLVPLLVEISSPASSASPAIMASQIRIHARRFVLVGTSGLTAFAGYKSRSDPVHLFWVSDKYCPPVIIRPCRFFRMILRFDSALGLTGPRSYNNLLHQSHSRFRRQNQ
jgi:hypothetical protein